MLSFIPSSSVFDNAMSYLNTSHVIFYRLWEALRASATPYLNTSHVIFYRSISTFRFKESNI